MHYHVSLDGTTKLVHHPLVDLHHVADALEWNIIDIYVLVLSMVGFNLVIHSPNVSFLPEILDGRGFRGNYGFFC